jgi:hypothetical protein
LPKIVVMPCARNTSKVVSSTVFFVLATGLPS